LDFGAAHFQKKKMLPLPWAVPVKQVPAVGGTGQNWRRKLYLAPWYIHGHCKGFVVMYNCSTHSPSFQTREKVDTREVDHLGGGALGETL
jgi:hypothetical protein